MQLAHHRRTGAFRGDARDRSRGAVLIEAAFITPVFFMLIFGIIEVGLAMNDKLALAHAVRAGSRFASAAGADPYTDYGILKSVARESSAIPDHQIDLIVVYKADRFGDPPTPACQAGSSGSTCNVYTPADFDRPREDFGCQPGKNLDIFWCPMDRQVTLTTTTSPDYVGVWMKVQHPWITRMFGTTVTLTDSSVIQLEPRERQ